MEQPKITFSSWIQWKDRNSVKDASRPGVYLLANLETAPPGSAEALDERVIYIGETCSNSLIGRWKDFYRSATTGKFGHSGGLTYYRVFKGDASKLFVAAFPVDGLDGEMRSSFIRYVERKLIWEYAQEWGKLPICNRK